MESVHPLDGKKAREDSPEEGCGYRGTKNDEIGRRRRMHLHAAPPSVSYSQPVFELYGMVKPIASISCILPPLILKM